jgi:hypothetical protein
MWWTPWLWSFRIGGSILPSFACGDPVKVLQTRRRGANPSRAAAP